MLAQDPTVARADIYAALACGEIDEVRRIVDERPSAVNEIGGPRSWPPILYLCSSRIPLPAARENAVALLRILLDRGADPNAFYLGGNADIHYTALTCVLGRGEEQAETHPCAKDMTALLLDYGAYAFDTQVLYNVFAGHASRAMLNDDIVWLLELMHRHSAEWKRDGDWANPEWPMFDLFGAPSPGDGSVVSHGARFMLEAALDRNLLKLAEWMLQHGAGPNAMWGTHRPNVSQRTLYEEATARGLYDMAVLLERYGAAVPGDPAGSKEEFLHATLAMQRYRVKAMIDERPEYLKETDALFAAVALDRDDAVALLLDLGMSPDVTTRDNDRALHHAAYHGAEKCAALLIARGAEVDPVNTAHDAIPLGMASFSNRQPMIELIGRFSRNIWELAYTGRVERIRELLSEEPQVARATSGSGDSPLMWLPDDEDDALAIASLLIEHGADPARRNDQGVAAAEIAAQRGMNRVAELLRGIADRAFL